MWVNEKWDGSVVRVVVKYDGGMNGVGWKGMWSFYKGKLCFRGVVFGDVKIKWGKYENDKEYVRIDC